MRQVTLVPDTFVNPKTKQLYSSELGPVQDVSSLNDLGLLSCECHLTPGVFYNNRRTKSNLKKIDWVCFDFDDGTPSETIHNRLTEHNLSHLIVGSKNHLKDKNDGKGIVERFHVFLPLIYSIDKSDTYDQLWVALKCSVLQGFNPDEGAKDAARYLFKHSSVLYCCDNMLTVDYSRVINEYVLENTEEETTVEPSSLSIVFDLTNTIRRQGFFIKVQTPVETFKHSKGFKWLTKELGSGDGRYAKRCSIVGVMKTCGLTIDEADQLFRQYNGYGGKFNHKSLESLYKKG